MQTIKIICKCGNEWEASINENASFKDIDDYFINKPFNIGTDEDEKIVYPERVLFKGLDYL